MSLLVRLVLGHLVGDYVLQPLSLVLWKRRSPWGIAFHAGVVVLCSMVLLVPELSLWWMVAAASLWASHVVVDTLRAKAVARGTGNRLVLLLVDQGLHVGVILFVWAASLGWDLHGLSAAWPGGLAWTDRAAVYLGLLIIAAWFGPVLEAEAAATLGGPPLGGGEEDAVPAAGIRMSDRALGTLERLGAAGALAGSWWVLLPLVFAPRWLVQRQRWRTAPAQSMVKLCASAAVAVGMGYVLRSLPT